MPDVERQPNKRCPPGVPEQDPATWLPASLERFVDAFSRAPDSLGTLRLAQPPLPATEFRELGDLLATYFSHLSFDRPVVGGEFHLMLFGPKELDTAQQGWRWIRNRNGEPEEDVECWRADWIVIADRNGDAVFVDVADGTVWGSIQKRNMFIAPTLAAFLDALAACKRLEVDDYGLETTDAEFNPLPAFLQDVRALAEKTLGADAAAGWMHFFFG